LREKIAAASSVPSPFRFYNANVETLLASNNMGGSGFSGISANFYPWLHARLCAPGTSESDRAAIQRFLSVAEVEKTRAALDRA
jgi:4-hydroxy-tetrahydrodipicolinate synthase